MLLVHLYTEVNARQHNLIKSVDQMSSICAHMDEQIPNTVVLSGCGLRTMFTMLRQLRFRCLGHVRLMKEGRISRVILLIAGKRNLGRPELRY